MIIYQEFIYNEDKHSVYSQISNRCCSQYLYSSSYVSYAEAHKLDWSDTRYRIFVLDAFLAYFLLLSFDVREADGAAFYQVYVETEQGKKPGNYGYAHQLYHL